MNNEPTELYFLYREIQFTCAKYIFVQHTKQIPNIFCAIPGEFWAFSHSHPLSIWLLAIHCIQWWFQWDICENCTYECMCWILLGFDSLQLDWISNGTSELPEKRREIGHAHIHQKLATTVTHNIVHVPGAPYTLESSCILFCWDWSWVDIRIHSTSRLSGGNNRPFPSLSFRAFCRRSKFYEQHLFHFHSSFSNRHPRSDYQMWSGEWKGVMLRSRRYRSKINFRAIYQIIEWVK